MEAQSAIVSIEMSPMGGNSLGMGGGGISGGEGRSNHRPSVGMANAMAFKKASSNVGNVAKSPRRPSRAANAKGLLDTKATEKLNKPALPSHKQLPKNESNVSKSPTKPLEGGEEDHRSGVEEDILDKRKLRGDRKQDAVKKATRRFTNRSLQGVERDDDL